MSQHEHFLSLVSRLAEDVSPVANAKVAACVVRQGRVISFGVNQKKSHPLQKKYAPNEHKIYLHAEVAAIVQALKRIGEDELRKAALYVARVKRPFSGSSDWIPGLAKPCQSCADCLQDYGVKEVIYTT